MRTGWISVGDKKVYISQRAYDLNISPNGTNVVGNAGAGEFGVSASINDVWNAIVTEPWITLVSGYDAGTGSGVVRFLYTENNTGKTRTGKIIVSGEVYTLEQRARQMVAITATAEHGGHVSGGGSYDLGSQVTLTAVPDSGYAFSYWTGAVSSMQNPLTVTADVAKSYTAVFEPLPIAFTSVVSDTNGVSLTWNNLAWAATYRIYRGMTSVPGSATVLVELPNSGNCTYLDTTGDVDVEYWYWIEAEGPSDEVTSDPITGRKENPIVISSITYTNLRGATNPNPATYREGTLVSFVTPGTVVGYTFSGWTPSQITSDMTGAQMVRAAWTANSYSIAYDPNGGSGIMSPTEATYDSQATVAANGFIWTGHVFIGWATNETGDVVYTAGQSVSNMTAQSSGLVTLYAVWEERELTLADYVDCANLVFANDVAAAWTPDGSTCKVGGASLRSGAIPAADDGCRTNTLLTATVVGEGSGSFWWNVSCEEMDDVYDEWYDYAVFSIDGVEVAKIAGDSGWRRVEYAVTGQGPHTLAWTFTRDDYDEDWASWQNCSWLDGVVWTPTPVTVTFDAGGATEGTVPDAVTKYAGYGLTLPGAGTLVNGTSDFMGWSDGETTYLAGTVYVFGSADVTLTAVWGEKAWTFGEAVDMDATSAWTTGGDAGWTVDTSTGWTNGVSAKSGVVTGGQASWIEMTVNGAGTLTFRWNVMGGIYRNNPFAYAKMEVDGTHQAQEYNTDGWKEVSFEIEGTGAHTVRWTYLRTSTRTAEGDCAWLDGVMWNQVSGNADVVVDVGSGKTVTVPNDWLTNITARIEAAGGDAVAALQATAANGRLSNVECYILGLDPESTTNDFKIVSFQMKADGTPDLAAIVFEPPMTRWNVPGARAVLKGAATLKGGWKSVDEATAAEKALFRFFKVVVELP